MIGHNRPGKPSHSIAAEYFLEVQLNSSYHGFRGSYKRQMFGVGLEVLQDHAVLAVGHAVVITVA